MNDVAERGCKSLVVSQAVRRALRGRRARLGLLRGLSLACAVGMQMSVANAELPVVCVSGACGSGVTNFVSNGAATVATSGNNMTVNQTTANATLNWQSFNVSNGSSVNFVQPSSSSVALNRIYQSSASQIMGNLTANGRVYLLNQNGIVFGNGAQVNVAGLIASSLNISPYALNPDDSTNLTNAALSNQAAFQLFTDGNGNALGSGDVQVLQGANITTSEGGQVLLFAPNVGNAGTIRTPGGQTALAAGTSVYLTTSENTATAEDDYLRGLVIEVGSGGGIVTNGVEGNATVANPAQLVGQIIAERGNVTLAGLAVNQLGRVSATTSVSEGGSIRLVASAGTTISGATTTNIDFNYGDNGDLHLGKNSRTEVQLADSDETTVDSSAQPQSVINLEGNKVVLDSGAEIIAPHGLVTVTARTNANTDASLFGSNATDSRVYVADDAVIDVSGADITKSMASNVISVELRGDELADSELQRDGVLRGKTVQVDIRQYGTTDDGTEWQGSPIGDLSGYIAGIEKNVSERSLTGGTVTLQSQGDVILDAGSTIDISGGSITYESGYINTSSVLGADGLTYNIANADPGRVYTGLASGATYTVTDARWGVTKTYTGAASKGSYEQGYVEGKDAGTLSVLGGQMVLNGDVDASVAVGRYQRKESTEQVGASALYRSFDEMPLSGQLILGQTSGKVTTNGATDYGLGDVAFTSAPLRQMDADFDPWSDELSSDFNTLQLSTNLFGENGVGRLTLRANGAVSLGADTDLMLPAFGSVDIEAGAITLAGNITAHSGDIDLVSTVTSLIGGPLGGVFLTNGAQLDVSGLWVNDLAAANEGSVGTAVLAIDGGSVNVSAKANSVLLASGSIINASGGAQLTSSGAFKTGSGGSISLSNSSAVDATQMVLDGELQAYAFHDGGSLSINTTAVCIADADIVCTESDDQIAMLNLTPERFNQGGFAGYNLNSTRGGIELAAGTQLNLQQRNWLASQDLSKVVTGTALSQFAQVGLLSDWERQAMDLSLTVTPTLASGETYDSNSFATAGNLVIGAGAAINAEAGASIDLSASTRILVDGTISAPAGEISLRLTRGLELNNSSGVDIYFEDQGIWLGSHAQLLARGTTWLQANDQGRVSGEVLDGGAIKLDADRGHITTSAGSVMDVSGTAAILDIKSDVQGHYTKTLIGSAGGTLSLEAAEAIVVGGELRGASGDPGTVAAGTLQISLDPNSRNGLYTRNQDGYYGLPGGDRSIELTQDDVSVVFGNSSLPQAYQGRAAISVEQIEAGGFDSLSLTSKSYKIDGNSNVIGTGQIVFGGDVDLELARNLTLDATALQSNGGVVNISAPVVTLGRSDVVSGAQTLAATQLGSGDLTVRAQQIDVVGNSVLQGFANTTLQSSGDLRLIGVEVDDALQGTLSTAGDLTLSAAQVYPTTLTEFTVSAGTGTQGTLSITQNGTAAEALSAGGQLTLQAPNVVQAGTVRAPFGTITIDSPNITLADGSVTSTSGNGLSVLLGETQGGIDWVYVLGSGSTIVYGVDGASLPAQQVNLIGDRIDFQEGAAIDVSGGGELLASEFVSGTTGTLDVLGKNNASGSFAILPANHLASAAYDESIYSNSTVAAGTSVYLSGYGDLPAGEYIILPAKYALLPGAYLVTQVSGYQDITAGEAYSLADGSTIVSGYYTSAGTGLRDARSSGFAILAGNEIQDQAKYTLTSADTFFAAQAESAGLNTQRLPVDAGTLSITATTALDLNGNLLAAAENGRGVAVDIASAAINVMASADTPVAGVLNIKADDLNALGAESILLGGTRSEDEAGVSINANSTSVTLSEDAALTAPEIMLVATGAVTMDAGAALTATGAEVASKQVNLQGNGAFLRVSTSAAGDVVRSGGASGSVVLANGSSLNADGGSISVESANTASLLGDLSASGGELSLTGKRISLGDASSQTEGLLLNVAQLASLDLQQLSLNSRSSIDLYGDVSLSLDNLELNAAALRGFADGAVELSATGNISLGGAGASTDSTSSSHGALNLSAGKVLFGGGELSISGFESTTIIAQSEMRADADSSISVNGDLTMSAQRLTTASGVDLSMNVGGAATLASGAASNDLSTVTDLGGSFSLSADSIELATRIELPSGLVNLNADSGPIHLLTGATIDVSGRSTDFADEVVSSSGGNIKLTAHEGDLSISTGAQLNVSAAGAAQAGSIALSAADGALSMNGKLLGTANNEVDGGSFSADALSLGNLSALNTQLAAGGFTGDLALRLRGSDDLVVGSGEQLRGTSVSLIADQGRVQVNGSIRAHDEDGGRINLAARDGIAISGTLDARGVDDSERNGRIDLSVSEGGLSVASTAVIATTRTDAASGSAADGTVSIHLPQTILTALVDNNVGNDHVSLSGDWSNNAAVAVQGFKVYTDSDGVIDDTETVADVGNVYYADAADFAAQAASIKAALSNATLPNLTLQSGIEIRHDGDLTLNSDWDLSQWHFNGQAGALTLRATGNLTFNESLSDGFNGVGKFVLGLGSDASSWSYNLVAGADTSSADVLAVQSLADVAANSGNLTIVGVDGDSLSSSDYTMIRTGAGSIDVAAARNVVLSGESAMLYTAGVASAGTLFAKSTANGNALNSQYYPTDGGDITITAGADVIGSATKQLVTDWLWRVGNADSATTADRRSTAWTVNFGSFHQGVGALGGGDVKVTAGDDVEDLSVSTPSIGRQTGGTTTASKLEIIGGGNVAVVAGGDINGGVYYSGLGAIDLHSNGSVGASSVTGLNPILALGDTQASVAARQDLVLESVLNPTLLPQGSSQVARRASISYFSTYSEDASLDLTAVAGDVGIGSADSETITTQFTTLNANESAMAVALSLLPSTVVAQSLRGDVTTAGSITLLPASQGNLQLRAYDDVILNGTVIVSDMDPALLPGVNNPVRSYLQNTTSDDLYQGLFDIDKDVSTAGTPVRMAAAKNGSLQHSQIVAATGDVLGGIGQLYFGGPVNLYAGGDVRDLNLIAQNLVASDVTSIVAGGDIGYTIERTSDGKILANTKQITVDGPGALNLVAGGDVNLQNSAGISTRGNLVNNALGDAGASISLVAGLNGQQPQYDVFTQAYLRDIATYADALSDYMKALTGTEPANRATALTWFESLDKQQQAPLLQRILLAELRASAEYAASSDATKNGDYSRGFAALESLFPGSNPDTAAGEANPYAGDIALYFSRIYTRDGGDIMLLAPGGGVNAGLAAAPEAFGVAKDADELGIVTQTIGDIGIVVDKDLQVNESRIFAINDSDIVVWSSNGDIDAGRGAKTAISAPAPVISYDSDGHANITYSAALAGSGIQTRASTAAYKAGDVVLAAPRGVVNAGDAGIVAGNLTIAATAVLGADNIKVSGVSVGVPVDTGGLGASLAGVSNAASSASNAANTLVNSEDTKSEQPAPIAQAALSWLEVFVVGLGEENCRQDDLECLKRQ